MKRVIISFLVILFIPVFALYANSKYDKWLNPGFFKGYNVLNENPKSLQDFIDFKNYGGNFMHIGIDGFLDEDSPYNIQQNNINDADSLVNFCRQTGIYYAFAVRSGPGAYDTYEESQGLTGESRIWNTGNTIEQQKYAEMLNMIVTRYADDSLFVGLNLVVEPRPKVKSIPTNVSSYYKLFLENVFNIHMDIIYKYLIDKIRENDRELPIILENFAYSTPELFPSYEVNDPYIIYSTHNYQPKEYTNASVEYSVTYPGTYWNLTYLAQKYFDAAFMRDVIFSKVKDFQEQTGGTPVMIGEFGILKPQIGSNTYINDVLNVCKENGWHFALWDWRRGTGKEWNIENFKDDSIAAAGLNSWQTVLSYFNAPPVPNPVSPLNEEVVRLPVIYKWDSLTSFTKFEIEVYSNDGLLFTETDLSNASYVNSKFEYLEGKHYQWRVRSKNPGGKEENNSPWSEMQEFYVPAITEIPVAVKGKYQLEGNYPNPFNPTTTIKYFLPENSFLTLKVYDMLGREVRTLVNEFQNKGEYSVGFNAGNISSGIYVYRLSAERDNIIVFNEVKRMVLVK